MEKELRNPQQPEQTQTASHPEQHPQNPFKADAPATDPSPEEEAGLEQKRKEALTERD